MRTSRPPGSTNGPCRQGLRYAPRRARNGMGRTRARGGRPLRLLIRSPPPGNRPVARRPYRAGEALRVAGAVARPHGIVQSRDEGDGRRPPPVGGDTSRTASGARAVLGAMRCEVRWQQGHPARRSNCEGGGARCESLAGDGGARAAYTAMDGAYQLLGEPEHAVHDRLALEILRNLVAREKQRRSSRTSASRRTPKAAGTRRYLVPPRSGTLARVRRPPAGRRWQGSTSLRCWCPAAPWTRPRRCCRRLGVYCALRGGFRSRFWRRCSRRGS